MQTNGQSLKSSVFKLETNILAALVFFVPALIAWIPTVGYFAFLIPLAVFLFERDSNFVRFCAAESMCLCIIRLVFDVLFDLIVTEARVCAQSYANDAAFSEFWGKSAVPGIGAIVIGAIISVIMTIVVLYPAFLAYKRKMVKLPIIGEISVKVSNEFRVKIRRRF